MIKHQWLLVCAAKKECKMLVVLNIRTASTGISDNFFDIEQPLSPSAIPSNKETIEAEVLRYLSNSDHLIEFFL